MSGDGSTIRRVIGLVAALLLLAPISIEVQVPAPAGTLGGTLTLPAGRGPFPAVTTLTGSRSNRPNTSSMLSSTAHRSALP